jgi:hypothetical protein
MQGTTALTLTTFDPQEAGTTCRYQVRTIDNANNISGLSNGIDVLSPAPLTVATSATTWSWFQQSGQPAQVSPNVVVTPSGGFPPYEYLWEKISGDDSTVVSQSNGNSVKWNATVGQFFKDYTSLWHCRVRDSAGTTTYSFNVTVNFRKENTSRQ